MELLKANYLDTTTAIEVNSATETAEFVMLPDLTFQYVSDGFNNDLTTASLRVKFAETLTVSRIAMAGINAKEMRLFYNQLTANALALTSTGATTSSVWTSNSETGMFLKCTPVACTSVTLEMTKTMVADSEKAIGYFVVSQEHVDFPRIPAARGYMPLKSPEEVVHRLSDGKTRIQTIAETWGFDVKLEHITTSFRDTLHTLWKLHQGMVFVPFGTTTAWDQVIAPVVWEGPFNFYEYSDNAPSAGHKGSLRLLETHP